MSDLLLDDDINNGENGLSSNSIRYITETAKWTKFLSIVGFIFLGLFVILAIWIMSQGSSINSAMSRYGGSQVFPTTILGIVYLVMAVLGFFPLYYLYNFSVKMSASIKSGSPMSMESAFENLKSHYKFSGIFTIVILSIYILIFLFGLVMRMSI